MKIVCVGRNYVDHIKELNNELPKEPVIFMKPDSAILQNGKPFYIPDFSNNVHHEIEVVVRINRLGKNIAERFASRYYNEITLGIDFTARDLQDTLRSKGLPWERSKAFDQSAALGEMVKVDDMENLKDLNFILFKNGEQVQHGNTAQMIHSINQLIAEISKSFTLKIGDLIYTGTPKGVGRVQVGDELVGTLNGKEVLRIPVK